MAEAEAACAVLSVSLPASGAESESATSAPTMMLASVRVAHHSGPPGGETEIQVRAAQESPVGAQAPNYSPY